MPKNNVDPANAYGYTEFIDRLRKARDDTQLEEQRKETIFASGHRWNGQATVPKVCLIHTTTSHTRTPQEPKLGQGRSSSQKGRIKSLQKVAQPFDWNAGRHEGSRAASAQRGRSAGGRSEARGGSYGGNRCISPSRIPQPAAGDSDDQQDDFGVGSPMAMYRQPAGGDVVPRPFTFPPSWTTGHDSGFIDENAAVNDFLTSQHANVMAVWIPSPTPFPRTFSPPPPRCHNNQLLPHHRWSIGDAQLHTHTHPIRFSLFRPHGQSLHTPTVRLFCFFGVNNDVLVLLSLDGDRQHPPPSPTSLQTHT